MRILVDMDGIVTDTLPTWLRWIHSATGVKAEVSDITKWNLNENPPLDALPLDQILEPLDESGFTLNLPEMPNACLFLKKLHDDGHDISIVTARQGKNCMPETIEWIERMMPWFDVKRKLCFVYEKARFDADVIIDDKAEYLAEYKQAHPEAHLITIDYPFNKNAPAETHRVPNNGHEWETIEHYITKITKDYNDLVSDN